MLDDVQAALGGFAELTPGASAFGSGPAWWFGTKEVVHVDGSAEAVPLRLDVRVTRKAISANRPMLKSTPAVTLRSGSSDWLEVSVSTPDDLELLRSLCGWAVAAHREMGLDSAAPPPTGPALARRRRFH